MVGLVVVLRIVGLLEGLSFLVLLGIAMPLKYMADSPRAVEIVGALHGFLFVLYVILALVVTVVCKLPWWRLVQALLASLIPAGTFWFDRKLSDFQRAISVPVSKS